MREKSLTNDRFLFIVRRENDTPAHPSEVIMKWTELQGALQQAKTIRNSEVRLRNLISILKGAGGALPEQRGRDELDVTRELEAEIRRHCVRDKGIVPGMTVLYGNRGERQRGVVHSIAPGGWVTLIGAKRVMPPMNLEVVTPEVAQEAC
jgi:hypothetical protein